MVDEITLGGLRCSCGGLVAVQHLPRARATFCVCWFCGFRADHHPWPTGPINYQTATAAARRLWEAAIKEKHYEP